MTKAGKKIIAAAQEALASAKCDHDLRQEHDPRKPIGFEAWSCAKCGTRFLIPKYEAV